MTESTPTYGSKFNKAVKYDAKLRMALAGPSGSGKTYTALQMATILAQGGKIALVDTEHKSASKYADLFAFDTLELDNFNIQNFIDAIHDAEENGYAVLIIDSMSHAWMGTGGMLDMVDKIAARSKSGNSFIAWKEGTPIQNKFIDTIVAAKLHIICTLREKTEYVVETKEGGKTSPKKVGMAPIQRDGVEYEFDVFGEMDTENTLVITKSRCVAISGEVYKKPKLEPITTLLKWLQGVKPAPLAERPLIIEPETAAASATILSEPEPPEEPEPPTNATLEAGHQKVVTPPPFNHEQTPEQKKTTDGMTAVGHWNLVQALYKEAKWNSYQRQGHLAKHFNKTNLKDLSMEELVTLEEQIKADIEEQKTKAAKKEIPEELRMPKGMED